MQSFVQNYDFRTSFGGYSKKTSVVENVNGLRENESSKNIFFL